MSENAALEEQLARKGARVDELESARAESRHKFPSQERMINDASLMLRRMNEQLEEYRPSHADVHELSSRLKHQLDDAPAASETKTALLLEKDLRIMESTQHANKLEQKLADTQVALEEKNDELSK